MSVAVGDSVMFSSEKLLAEISKLVIQVFEFWQRSTVKRMCLVPGFCENRGVGGEMSGWMCGMDGYGVDGRFVWVKHMFKGWKCTLTR